MSDDFTSGLDLASERLGGKAIEANDEFFAAKENLVRQADPVFKPDEFTDHGKWMDGWETRRRREPGHDWCVVKLGLRGVIEGVLVDTAHFTGNFPEACSIDARDGDGEWIEILPKSPLQGDAKAAFPIASELPFTHVRLNIYPDGGVARLRVYGRVVPDWSTLSGEIDLACVTCGAVVCECSDSHFGSRHNLILPDDAINMGDGWETRRRRGPGHDWAIVELGAPGRITRAVVDTRHFKGNAPGRCSIEVLDTDGQWHTALPETAVRPHTVHEFDDLAATPVAVKARLNIFPDGGVARLRLYGKPER